LIQLTVFNKERHTAKSITLKNISNLWGRVMERDRFVIVRPKGKVKVQVLINKKRKGVRSSSNLCDFVYDCSLM
jgi:hypothetical protein